MFIWRFHINLTLFPALNPSLWVWSWAYKSCSYGDRARVFSWGPRPAEPRASGPVNEGLLEIRDSGRLSEGLWGSLADSCPCLQLKHDVSMSLPVLAIPSSSNISFFFLVFKIKLKKCFSDNCTFTWMVPGIFLSLLLVLMVQLMCLPNHEALPSAVRQSWHCVCMCVSEWVYVKHVTWYSNWSIMALQDLEFPEARNPVVFILETQPTRAWHVMSICCRIRE